MSKTNLIIDGNNIFHQSLFVVNSGKPKNGVLLDTIEEQEMLIRKVATDLAFTVRHFTNISRVIFTIDSHSWRKTIEIEENAGYKSTREKNNTINWNAFYTCMNEFAKILSNQGIIVSKVDSAEGDDLMYLWQKHFKEIGENSIIVTSDKDMLQMVDLNEECFTIIYRPNSLHRKIVAPIGFTKWLQDEDEVDIFNSSSFMGRGKDIITAAMEKIPLEELNGNQNIIEKVFVGDGGDAVPTVFSWNTTAKSGNVTTNRLTAKKVEKILEEIGQTVDVLDLPSHVDKITKSIKCVTKTKDVTEEYILKQIERNIKLVVLHESTIPQEIQEKFTSEFQVAMTLPTIATKQFTMHTLLEGTRFVKAAESFQSDIFSGINKYTKQKKKLF